MTNDQQTEWLSSYELADELGIHPVTPSQWRQAGEGPPYVIVGSRSVRYRRADVEAWLEARRVEPASK